MSGHSKWANIKHKKGKMDAVRGKITTKIAREITVAVRLGGSDPTGNMKLKLALTKAKANNIPKENIQRAIQKGLGAADGSNYEELVYEGYGPGGSAVLLNVMTDNRNRTTPEIRALLTRNGGQMGEAGSVAWMFDRKGRMTVDMEGKDEDELMMLALDAGAEDFSEDEDSYEILTSPEDFDAVLQALNEGGIPLASAEVTMIPQNYVELTDETGVKNLQKILDLLDEDDDVQAVYHNWDE